ncbi:hypothetical protein HanXRQr2_Chr01g0001931 [Helianthus annuus]|uniref:Uncharacterized protein n=1 Tax=Helianthus annuus TaxID=4232 RepID=A0A9K3JS88_HELAN|nr:hypothetical protein HanXRQr2_Chr01g0001931 [Helianthus annuus]KAJ0955341.1 hypothetical protein HanPSC8_Chr01g0001781 [Helianthus annuus]
MFIKLLFIIRLVYVKLNPYSISLEEQLYQLTLKMKAHYFISTTNQLLSYEYSWYTWLAP